MNLEEALNGGCPSLIEKGVVVIKCNSVESRENAKLHLELMESHPFAIEVSNWEDISGGQQLPSYRIVVEEKDHSDEFLEQFDKYAETVHEIHQLANEQCKKNYK